jgi:glyoxylase-like metal-dependent hydrolase (beta-lactamase superfamily II)
MKAEHAIMVHRFEAGLFPVNAYLIETPTSVVVVDATLGVTDGRNLRSRVEALRKPLAAVIVTHAHPDHYGGLAALLGDADVPVYAVAGVNEVIRRDDPAKEQILRPMFGDEWPTTRRFPTQMVQGGERVSIADAVFRVTDLGPSESPHDSLWQLESDSSSQVFVGDLVYSHMHAFLPDGYYDRWLVNLERATRDLPADAMLFMGHGQPVAGHAILDWQTNYIRRFLDVLRTSIQHDGLQGDALKDAVTAQMKQLLPTDDLVFLMQLSVEPMRLRLGLQAGKPTSAKLSAGAER